MVKNLCGAAASAKNRSVQPVRSLRFDILEPRMMFDGAMAADVAAAAPPPDPTADDGGEIAAAPTDVLPSALPSEPASQIVVFIDTNVADPDAIAASAPPGAEIHRLTEGDGLAQIAAALDGRSDITAIHIFSHGEAGVLRLGTTSLTADNVNSHTEALSEIGRSLSANGDILIYGCDVGAGTTGDALLSQLSVATGADVAASTDTTGATSRGGDWTLETVKGTVEATAIAVDGYDDVLTATYTAGNEFQVNTTTAGNQLRAMLTTLSGGGFSISWDHYPASGPSSVRAQDYDAAGNRVGGEYTTTRTYSQTTSTTLPDGSVTVAAVRDSSTGWTDAVTATRTVNGVTGKAMRLETDSRFYTYSPTVMTLANGSFVVAWHSQSRDGDVQGVFARIVNPDTVNVAPTGVALPNNVVDEDKGLNTYISTLQPLDRTFGDTHTYTLVDNAGGLFKLVGTSVYAASSLAGHSGDQAIVVRVTDAAGNSFDQTLTIKVEKTLTAATEPVAVNTTLVGNQENSDVAKLQNGGYVVTWQSENQDGSGYGVYGQLFNQDGTKSGGEFKINTYTATDQYKPMATSLNNGNFVVTWASNQSSVWQTCAQMYTATGATVGSEFIVHRAGGLGGEPAITALADGGFFVTTESYEGTFDTLGTRHEVYGQRFNAAGTAVGSAIVINTTQPNDQSFATVRQLTNGNLAVVWDSISQDGSGSGVFGQIIDLDGNKIGGEFQANVFTAGTQSYPQIAALTGGGFAVSWASSFQDAGIGGIFARVFNANGTPVGTEFQVNTWEVSEQRLPDITATANGGFIVAWQSDYNGELSVRAQNFDAAGTKVGEEYRVNKTGSYSSAASVTELSDGRIAFTWQEEDTLAPARSTGIYTRIMDAPAAGNTAPVAAGVANQTATEDSAFSYQVGAFTDPGDTLTYTATKADGSALPTWLSFDPATRTFSGTPANGDVGAVSVKVTATDTANAATSASFSITVANTNDAPVAASLGDQTATVGTATSWQATAFTDVDVGDSLTYTATKGDGTALPTWLSFNATTRTFSGTPPQGSTGVIGLKVIATDVAGATASASFNLTVSGNTAPAADGTIGHQLVVDREPWTMTVPSDAFSDADGDSLTYSATLADGTARPAWIDFDPATRTFSGTPGTGDVGTVELKVIARDTAGATAAITFKVTVGNVIRSNPPIDPKPPRSDLPPNDPPPPPSTPLTERTSGNEGSSFLNPLNTSPLGLSPSSVGGDSFALAADTRVVESGSAFQMSLGVEAGSSITITQADGQAAPAWIKVDAATGTVSGTPPAGFAGEVVLNVVVKDAAGREATKQIVVKVEGKQTGGERSGKDRQAMAKPSLGAQLGNAGRTAFVAQRQALTDAVRG